MVSCVTWQWVVVQSGDMLNQTCIKVEYVVFKIDERPRSDWITAGRVCKTLAKPRFATRRFVDAPKRVRPIRCLRFDFTSWRASRFHDHSRIIHS